MNSFSLGALTVGRRIATALFLCAVGLSFASAMSIRELRTLEKSDARQGGNYMRYYLVGAMEGALAAHDQAVRSGVTATICLNGRRLLPEMAEGLYRTELKRNKDLYEADMPVPMVMANAMATVYPC